MSLKNKLPSKSWYPHAGRALEGSAVQQKEKRLGLMMFWFFLIIFFRVAFPIAIVDPATDRVVGKYYNDPLSRQEKKRRISASFYPVEASQSPKALLPACAGLGPEGTYRCKYGTRMIAESYILSVLFRSPGENQWPSPTRPWSGILRRSSR